MTYRIEKKEFFYLIALTAYLLTLVLAVTVLKANSTYMNVAKYIRYACYLLAVIKILMDCFDAKSFYTICIIAILVAITVWQINSNTYLFYVFMIIAAKDVSLRKIIRQACIVQGSVLLVFVIGSQLGLVENFLFLQGGRDRFGLGFEYTTFAPILFLFFMMEYLYLRKERMRIYEFAILEAINYWFFFKTNTRFTFYLSTILLIYVFFMRYFWQSRGDRIRKNRWIIIAPSACCVGGILLNACYKADNTIWEQLNEVLNTRLALGRDALQTYGVTLFGQPIKWVGNGKFDTGLEYNYVDCSYMQLLLSGGIVLLILVIIAYTYIMHMAIQTNDFYLQTIVLFIVIFSIMEPRLWNLAYNPFPLLAATAWRTRSWESLIRKEPFTVPGVRLRTSKIRLKDRC